MPEVAKGLRTPKTPQPELLQTEQSDTEQVNQSDYITIPEYATKLGVSVGAIREWVQDGILPVYRFGYRTVRIHKQDAAEFEKKAGNGLPMEPAKSIETTKLKK